MQNSGLTKESKDKPYTMQARTCSQVQVDVHSASLVRKVCKVIRITRTSARAFVPVPSAFTAYVPF